MHGEDREVRNELDCEVAVGDGVHAVAGDPAETEFLADPLAVDRQCAAGDRAGAERHDVDPFAAAGEPFRVAVEHLDIGEQMVREKHRLRVLQVREAGHDRARMGVGLRDQRPLKMAELRDQGVDFAAQVEPDIERDLVVAAAGRSERARPLRRAFNERALDVHVDVFHRDVVAELPGVDAALDPVEFFPDRLRGFRRMIPCSASMVTWALLPAISKW